MLRKILFSCFVLLFAISCSKEKEYVYVTKEAKSDKSLATQIHSKLSDQDKFILCQKDNEVGSGDKKVCYNVSKAKEAPKPKVEPKAKSGKSQKTISDVCKTYGFVEKK